MNSQPSTVANFKIAFKEHFNLHNKNQVYYVTILKDGRLASVGGDNKLIISEPSNNFKIDITIDVCYCYAIFQFDNGLILTLGENYTLWSLTETELKKEFTYNCINCKGYPLSKNRFACSSKNSITIYSANAPYSKEPIANLTEHGKTYNYPVLVQLKDKEILFSAHPNNFVCLWDLNTYSLIKKVPTEPLFEKIGEIIQADDDNIMIDRYIYTISTEKFKYWITPEEFSCEEKICTVTRTRDGKILCTWPTYLQDWGFEDQFFLYDPKTGKYERDGNWTDLFRMNTIDVINEHTLVAGCLYPSKEDSIKLIHY